MHLLMYYACYVSMVFCYIVEHSTGGQSERPRVHIWLV